MATLISKGRGGHARLRAVERRGGRGADRDDARLERAGCRSIRGSRPGNHHSRTTSAAAAPDGAALFATSCAGCHGDKGQGGAVVKEAIELQERTDAQVATLISKGRGGMPGFAQLSDAEVAALIATMRGWNAPVAAPSAAAGSATITTTSAAAAPDGAALFATSCAGCHGDKGQGGAVAGEALELQEQTDAQVATLISKGRGGMPGFAQLSDAEVAALIATMRGWSK